MFILKNNRVVSLILVLILTISLLQLPSPAVATAAKIHDQVRSAYTEDNFVQVLIKLSLQGDISRVPPSTTQGGKLAARKAVVQSLQETAAVSQRELLNILNTAKDNGLAREIRSFYIVNIIYAEVHTTLLPALSRRSDVAAILPNAIISREDSPGQTVQAIESWNLNLVNAPQLHASGIRGDGVVVGIIDTGVDWSHPDLQKSWRGYSSGAPALNWYDAVGGKEMPYDDDGHGTHVAGIIAGEKTGVAPGASWIAVKAFDEYGDANSAWLLSAGEYMLAPLDANGTPRPEMAPDIINNSWGRESGMDEWYRPMVQAWRAAGILPVFAAGNGSGSASIYNPANYPESLAVGAVNWEGRHSSFSAEGPAPYPEVYKPDLAAPGENISSTKVGGGYSSMSGTSVAAPHVTGIAALLLAQDPSLGPEILEAVFRQTAQPLTDNNFPQSPNYGYGYGLVQADAALALIQSELGIIRGRVSTPISGVSAPVIQHSTVHEYYIDASLPIYAQIQDQLGVAKAEVSIWDAGDYLTYPMAQVDGDSKDGSWLCWLPFDKINSPSLEYSILAENRAGIESISGPHLVTMVPGVLPPYAIDFSQFPLGWIWDGEWEWGRGRNGPQPRYGDALFGTALEGSYAPDSWSSLYAPPLDLRDSTNTEINLRHWFDLAPGDSGQVFISADNLETWEVLATFTGNSGGWKTSTISLAAWDNWENPVILGFDLLAEAGGGGRPGWFIDEFTLQGQSPHSQVQSLGSIKTQNAGVSGTLPLVATLTILETGETTQTGYSDGIFAGSFTLLHQLASSQETITLRVEAPGYRPLEQVISITAGETLELDLDLEPLDFTFLRLGGSNRFGTAAAVSQAGWQEAETVVLARGDDYADALAGVPLASALDAPILLTNSAKLPDLTRQELIRLQAKKVILLGGSGAISLAVEAELAQELGLEVERLKGSNRYATAAAIARRLGTITSFDTAILAYGNNFPDALAAAPYAAALGMPILLTQTKQLPQDTALALTELGITQTIVAGGTGVVSNAVYNQLPLPLRLEGQTRYYTAVALAHYFQPQSQRLYLATGRDFADAISGAVLAARDDAALLLVGDVVPHPVSQFILEYGPEEIRLLGGTAVIPETIPTAIKMLAAQP